MYPKNNKEEDFPLEEENSAAEDRQEENLPLEEENVNEEAAGEDDEFQKLAGKHEQLNDSYLRLLAEYENYRKRTLKEKAELIKNGGESVLTSILPVIDDFERALDLMRKTNEEQSSVEGVELIYHKFITFLKQNGVKPMETEGQVFDPEYHEAITTIPAPSEDMKGKIVDCIQRGYFLNDKVIRFAKVVVGE